jgi:hypothetical protein
VLEAGPVFDLRTGGGPENSVAWETVEPVFDRLIETATQLRKAASDPSMPLEMRHALVAELDAMEEVLQQAMEQSHDGITLTATTAASVSLVVSIGYLVWAVRGGWLLASLMMTMPTWCQFDPLPVLMNSKKKKEADRTGSSQDVLAARYEEEVDDLFAGKEGART